MNVHLIIRTSPKGKPFLGECKKCGSKGLSISQMYDPCANSLFTSEDDVLFALSSKDKTP